MTNLLIHFFIKDHENTSDPGVRFAYGRMAGITGIACNIFLFAFKILCGFLSHSVSITADAVNNLSDASSNIISLIGFKMGSKPADREHPYGHARYEYLAGVTVTVLILAIGLELLKSSFTRLLHPEPVEFHILTVIILCLSIGIKLWMMLFNSKIGLLIQSGTLKATAADSRNDVLTTSAVLIATMISHYTNLELDALMGIAVALFILFSGFGLIRETLDPLLGKAPEPEFVKHVQEKILSYEGVLGTHDLMVHDYGPGRQFASVHVEMNAEMNPILGHEIIDTIERDFLENENLHIVIHYDPIAINDSRLCELRIFINNYVQTLNPEMNIHDLRLVPGENSSNIIFDCVVPPDCKYSQSELRQLISQTVTTNYPNTHCVITFDSSYAPVQH